MLVRRRQPPVGVDVAALLIILLILGTLGLLNTYETVFSVLTQCGARPRRGLNDDFLHSGTALLPPVFIERRMVVKTVSVTMCSCTFAIAMWAKWRRTLHSKTHTIQRRVSFEPTDFSYMLLEEGEEEYKGFGEELGIMEPIGFWDPLACCDVNDVATFKRRRSVELKNGRVAMLAFIGYIVPEIFRWPGSVSPTLGPDFHRFQMELVH